MKLTAIRDTKIKYEPVQSSTIKEDFLVHSLSKKESLEINWIKYDADTKHYLFELKEPINGRFNWYAYKSHFETDSPINTYPNLKVPYFSQRDNKIRPSQTCNVTSMAMVIAFYDLDPNPKDQVQLEDEITRYMVNKWGNRSIYYHGLISQAFNNWGVKSRFSTTTSWRAIKEHLQSGHPVIYSGRFTRSGHIIVLRGFDDKGCWVNDPWGEWFSSGYQATSGENLHYSWNMMHRLSYGGSKAAWAHLCKPL
ncbi:C39 family peptidase [Picosynechococcus sp. PCC 7117]|uniref:C39 family peptidase n=1 Tax=Picosynechococcus sp. PCC 7117 TaxID=195498 RepID=UPI000810E9D2|nr:C39 family peptidase [Picosynechococcus sp. PCC 7117]ANV88510.1 hypothetical protein AWQ22_14140 [Picosynechococcus sp. PCC 7117]